MRRVLVTGATGFVGSHLLELLQHEPIELFAWHRTGAQPRRRPAEPGASSPASTIRWTAVDVLEPRAVRDAIARDRPNSIYHCAGAAHVGGSWHRTAATLETNVLGTHHLLDAVRREGLRTTVLLPGSAAVYRESTEPLREEHPLRPASPYGLSKLAQELIGVRSAIDDGLDLRLTRSFNHIGARQDATYAAASFARQIARIEAGLDPPLMRIGNLEPRRDLTDVRDTVRAYRMLMERGRSGVPYNVCSGKAYSIRELLDGLLADAAIAVTLQVDPQLLRPNDNPVVLGVPDRIREEVGWEPTIPLATTLHDVLEYWRSLVGAANPR